VAFFDLDKTIIAGSSTLAFSGPLRERGLIGRRALLRSGYAQLLLMVAGADADFMERMRSRISALCAGWDAVEVRSVIEDSIHEILPSMIYTEARELIAAHRADGDRVVVVSASGVEMVEPVARALGADDAVGTRMQVEHGRYTGEIEFYCYGEGKAEAARALAAEHGYRLADCFAYSDSITDRPLLEAVGHPRAVNPDRELRRLAVELDWPVLDFRPPVPLGTRVGRRARSVLAGLPRSVLRRVRGELPDRRDAGPVRPSPVPVALAVGGVAAVAMVAGLTAVRVGRTGRAGILRSASAGRQAGDGSLNG
jgi:HAD superfamily hydrolase (TIGR01490 family)